MKLCRKCGEKKKECGFHLSSRATDGLQSWCKECMCAGAAEYRKRNPIKTKQYRRKYYKKNYDKIADSIARWRKSKNGQEYRRGWQAKNREKYSAHYKLYYQIKCGNIIRPTQCSSCKNESSRIEGHHSDYSKPLDVMWLCKPCHYKIHNS